MVLGMSLSTFTLLHVVISLVAILTGLVVLYGMLTSRCLDGWTGTFLVTTVLTSVTGFFFPFEHLLPSHVVGIISLALLAIAIIALYLKTKNFHWHMSGPHFRDYHLLLDEQADQLYAMTDPIAERVRKLGGTTLRSIGHISRLQRVLDNDADYVDPLDMLAELREDNKTLAARLREAHNVVDEHGDIATASLIEVWIDETERRTWFLFEASRRGG